MKIALSADFHLDIRQFNNQQRWTDFLDTFIKITHKVKERNADAYVLAGDIFHKYRPHPGIVRRFLKEISSVDCPVLLIRGNHDSPQILFEKYGGDILHLIRDVSDIVYLNKKRPTYEVGDLCFFGMGYIGFNTQQEIRRTLQKVKTSANTKIGVFHQLLDYPGVPETNAEISRSYLRNLGFDFVLMGHYHIAYSEKTLFNSGSPEYWAFDQGKQIEVNLDDGTERVKPAERKGLYILETNTGKHEFLEVQPARPMFLLKYKTEEFNEKTHLHQIRDHLEQYNIPGAMVKSIIYGKHKFGRRNLTKNIALENPLIHNTTVMLTPSNTLQTVEDSVKAQTEYLIERGIDKEHARTIAEWLENNKGKLASIQGFEILEELRSLFEDKKELRKHA